MIPTNQTGIATTSPPAHTIPRRTAKRLFDEAHQRNSRLSTLACFRGLTEMATGHYAKALRCFEAVEEWDEGAYVEARMQRAIILAAAPEKSLRNIEVAEELARQACAISNFTDWQSLHVFAIATAANGKFDKATEYIEQALEDVPDDQLARVRKDANVIKAGEAVLLNKDGVAPFLE